MPTDFNYDDAERPRLVPKAVPSKFYFPERLQKINSKTRRALKRNADEDAEHGSKKIRFTSSLGDSIIVDANNSLDSDDI